MYKSPITIIQEQMQPLIDEVVKKTHNAYDEHIVYACRNTLEIDINKEELEKALKYDRNQYDAGYADGYKVGRETALKVIESMIKVVRGEDDNA